MMFLQVLYAIVKGLLEMDGYQVNKVKSTPEDAAKICCPTDGEQS